MEDIFFSFSLGKFLFLSAACFMGSFVDAIAGGGGIITVPAYILTGFPIHFALGTNKFSSVFLCLGSSLRYLASGKINISVIKYPAIISFCFMFRSIYC